MRGSSLSFARVAFALAFSLCASSAAFAQATVQEVRIDGFAQLTELNRESCSDATAHSLRIDVRNLTQQSYTIRFIRYPDSGPNGPCPTSLQDPEIVEVDEQSVDTPNGRLDATYALTIAELIGDDCASDGEGASGDVHFCFQLTALPGDVTAVIAAGVEILYDTSLPPRPSFEDVTTGDTSVTVELEDPDDGEGYTSIIEYRECGEDDASDAGTDAEDADSECGATGAFKEADADDYRVVIGSLKANTPIELRAHFVDAFKNVGPSTALRTVTPESTLGPLSLYDGTDNPASCEASCADTTSASLFLVLGGLSRRGRRALRRARKQLATGARLGLGSLLALLSVMSVMTLAAPARAELGQMTIGLGLAPYKPAIDTELAEGSRQRIFPIYSCFFDDATLAEVAGEIDTHLFDGFGSVQFTTGLSLSQAQGFAQPTGAKVSQSCQKPTDIDVQLTLAKLRPGVTYRFDPLLDWVGFPLVPYGRLGAVVAAYAFTKDADFDQGGMNPVGLRFGWEGALGLMLALDFLDSIDPFVPDTTRRARANGVFDHTFLFVEGAYQDITSFGQPGLVLTPIDELIGTQWPVLWKIGLAVELL